MGVRGLRHLLSYHDVIERAQSAAKSAIPGMGADMLTCVRMRGSAMSRGSRDSGSWSRRRPATSGASAHDDPGGSFAASRRSGGAVGTEGRAGGNGKKTVSTVGRDGDLLGKTVKITHEFDREGAQHASSGDGEDDGDSRGSGGHGKPLPKALAWVAGMDPRCLSVCPCAFVCGAVSCVCLCVCLFGCVCSCLCVCPCWRACVGALQCDASQ